MIGSAELIFLFDFHSYLVFNPSPRCCGTSGSVLVAPQLQGAATEGIGDSFVSALQSFKVLVLGVFCARFPPRKASNYFLSYYLVRTRAPCVTRAT